MGSVLTKQVPEALAYAVAVKTLDVTEFFSERGGGDRAYLAQLFREGTLRGHRRGGRRPCGPRAEESTVHGGRLIRVKGPAMPYDPRFHALWNHPAQRALDARERSDVLKASSPYLAAWCVATQPEIPMCVLVRHSGRSGCYARPVLSRFVGAHRSEFPLASAHVYAFIVETFGFALAGSLAQRSPRALPPPRWKPRWPSNGYSTSHLWVLRTGALARAAAIRDVRSHFDELFMNHRGRDRVRAL